MGKASRLKKQRKAQHIKMVGSNNFQESKKLGFAITLDDDFGLCQVTENESIIMQHIQQIPERQSVLHGINERKRLNSNLPFIIRIGNGVIVFVADKGFYMVIFMGGTDDELLEKAERWKQSILTQFNLSE
jgi:hypothetical protein